MKRIIKSNFKFSLSKNINKKIINFPVKQIRSSAGIRAPPVGKKDKIDIEDVVGKRVGKVGIVELNREHKCNVLTENFMTDIRRSLEAMEIDEDMRVVLMRSKYFNSFCMGTDLKYIYFNKLNGEYEKIDQYLEKLYNFNHFIAVYHKPLLGLCTGQAKGSGVSFLTSCSFPMSTETTEASFPETGYGYIPDGGSMFFLSRLEGELGTFLALTGFPIVNWDLVKLGLTKSFTFPDLEEPLSTSTIGRNIFGSLHEYTEKWDETFKNGQKEKTLNNFNNMHSHLSRDELKKMNLLNNDDPFTYPWERTNEDNFLNQSPTVFHSMIEKDIHSDKKVNFKHSKGRYFNDTYENFMNLVYSRIPIMEQRYFSLAHIVKDINRLFRFNTVKEIYEALKEENSYFSEMCLAYLDQKSPLSLEVTLRMLRNARKMNYTEIIKQEINVAKNLIMKNKDFDLVMQSRISHSKENIKFAKSLSQVTKEDVDEIFEDSKILSKIKLDVKDNSLLPHNKYFQKYPDCFRLWINENPRSHGDIRENFDYEVKHYMIEKFGIDLRDTNITIDEVRKILTKIETNQHTIEKNNTKFSNLLSDPKFMNEYFNKRQEVISKFENNKDGLKDLVSTKMKKLYQDNLEGMTKRIYDRCRDIREIEKRRTYLRLKRWLFMNRIMEYKTRRRIISNERIEALGPKAFFIPKDDHTSYRDQVNPELKNSPFYKLVGLFTEKTISPEYALRFSTTDPNKDIFTYLEINQEKLKEIKEQLKQNPKKFLEVWDTVYDKQAEAEFNEIEDKSLGEYERVYRMRHEGHSTLDKLPYYKEFQELKSKWHEIKRQTTEALKKLTHDLISEIIEKENIFNKNLKEAAKDPNLGEKFEDVKALYNIVNDNKSEIEEFYEMTSNGSNQVEERVNILKQNINSAINNDPFYQKLNQMIQDAEKSQNNEMKQFLTNFNNKVMELTHNLITKSLLDGVDKNTKFNHKDVESTLIKLFNPQNIESSFSFNSNFIHWLYLKYGTQNIFSEILKKSKFSIISLLKNQLENELFNHNNIMLSKIQDNKIDIIKVIYNKEKSMLEDVLKNYFQTKLQLLNMDLLEKKELIANGNSNSVTIDYVIDTLSEISFCHLLFTNSENVPRTLNSILSSFDSAHKEKTLMELYVNVQQTISQNDSNEEISENLKNLYKFLSLEMKNSEWFKKLTNYANSSTSNESVNIDQKIETFMKKRFNEIIYSNSSQDVDYHIDMRKVGEMLREKLDVFSLNQLVNDYRNDKLSLNEENVTPGIFSDPVKLNEKKEFYSLKLKFTEKLKKIENQFNIDNLKKKYSDYLFNADFYIHKILCNVKNPEQIFFEKIEDSQKYGKFLFELKRNLDETYFDLSNENNKSANVAAESFNHLTRLKTILFNQKEYVENLESLNQFIKNKTKFNDLIEKEFSHKLNFVSKYEVKILLNDIQADSEKLYNHLNSIDDNQKLSIDRKEFLIPSENFFKQFGRINLDELIGLEGSKLEYLNELNKRIKDIVKSQLSAFDTELTVKRVDNIKEISARKQNIISDLNDSKLKDFSSKVQSTIKGLKTIQAIKRNLKHFNKSTDLNDYVNNINNPGLNFSRVIETLLGRKLSLQELILDDREKTLHDYLQDNTFDKVFSKKIPTDLVKCAIQVLDARLIKALKLILSSELQNEYSLNDFINYTGNNNYLQLQPGHFTDQELLFYSELSGDLEDYKVDYMDGKGIIEPEQLEAYEKVTEEMNKTAEEAENYLNETKKIVIADSNGHKILIKYKKGSIFNNIINIHRLNAEKKREVGDKLLKKLQEIVPLPDLSSQYTLLKYVYDYHMGNLQTFYESHRKEAESRIYSLNNVIFLENIERMEKYDSSLTNLYPEKNFFNANTINNDEDPLKEFNPTKLEVNLERKTTPSQADYELFPTYNKTTEHLYKYKTNEQKKLIERSRNLAYKIFVTKMPSDWYMAIEYEQDPYVREILKVELDYYFKVFNNMQLAVKGTKENTFHDRKAATMSLTEEFRANQEKVRSDNETLRKNEFNLNDPEAIGFNHIIKNNNNVNRKETEYFKVLDDMFGEYLKNRKNKLAFTKEKIREQKEKFAQMDNIRVLNPYELITNSQDAYIDMKSGKINEDKFKMSIQSFLKWNNLNKEYAVFDTTDLTDIVDLDNSTSRALYGKYASVPSDLVNLANEDPDAQFKGAEHALDKTEDVWFEEQIEEVLSDFLSHRSQVEKYLTRDQLAALDEDLIKNFTHENFINRIKQNLNREVLSFNFLNDVHEHMRNSENDQSRQRMKMKNMQFEFNKNLKDENAFYQNIAYQLRNDKEYNDRIEEDIRKKKKLGRSIKPDKNIEHPLADDLGWKKLYYTDLTYAQLFNKSRVDNKEKFLYRMRANEVNSLDKSVTYEGVTPNQKLNHMKTIVEEVENNSERINGLYRRKANDILTIMREKSDRLDKLNKFNDYVNSNKIGKMH